MENIDFVSLFAFTCINIFTPGPANIACTSMAIKHGLRESINFISGASIGFTLVTLLAGLFSNFLLVLIPSLESIMRWVGSAYILYLAYNILKTDYSLAQNNKNLQQTQPLSFRHGVFLQLFNPKSLMFVITIYTVFLYPLAGRLHLILLSTLILGLIGSGSYLLWAFLGAGISSFMNQEHFKRIVNLILALLLVYSAIKLTGIFKFLV